MKRARRLGRHAGPVLAATMFVATALVWLPVEPSGVIALSAQLVDPSASATADPTPAADPTPSPVDPGSTPDPGPTPDPSSTIDPTPQASAEPTPTPSPTPTPTPTPTPLPPGVIGADGGSVIDGDVTILVPEHSVTDPTRFYVERVALPDPDLGASLLGFSITAEDEATGQAVQAFGAPLTLVISTGGWDLSGVDPDHLTIAEFSGGSWWTIASGSAGSLAGTTDHAGTFAVQGQLLPARVDVDHTSDAPPGGRHRLEPGSTLAVSIEMRTASRLPSGNLVETIPAGWSLADGDGGQLDPAASTVTWPLRSLAAGATVAHTLRLRAPSVPFDGQLALTSTFSVRVEQGGAMTDGPDLEILVAPRVVIQHVTAGRVERAGGDATYLAPDRPLLDEPRYRVFRLRFEVRNADNVPVRWAPRLEFRRSSEGLFVPLPAGSNVPGVAFYAAPEWVRLPGAGTAVGPSTHAVIDARELPTDAAAEDRAVVDGTRVLGLNPAPEIVLPPRSRTVVEFSVRATVDAAYAAGYDFRLTDLGETFPGEAEALVVLEPEPQVQLSAGQRVGVSAGATRPISGTPIKFALSSPTVPPGSTGDAAAGRSPSLRFALVPQPGASSGTANAAPAVNEPIHGPAYGLTTDSCAACHSTHRGAGSLLTTTSPPQLGTCGACHDGVTAPGIQAAYASAPQNDPADRAFYRHDPAAIGGHEGDGSDALAAQFNRHNECADCHNPHNATAVAGTSTTSGWTASGRIAGASGVTAENGSPGSSPTYTLAAGTTFEYQLCLKCHSGYTDLLSNAGLPPSRYALDKAVEFNPANLSYHPVEAPGTNATTAMLYSLRGTSPFKQWTFSPDSTIRCVNCHADAGVLASAASIGSTVPAEANLPVHASPNRGILLSSYLDRQLKGPVAPYDPADFGLCYLCHAEAPFRDTTGAERPDTNFRYHGFHVSGGNMLDHGSNGTDIDAAGDGGGLATCSECHFRIHSTSFAVNNQAAGSRLVNFAPNVTPPTGGTLGWRPRTWLVDGTPVAGGCSLKCHGQPHAKDY